MTEHPAPRSTGDAAFLDTLVGMFLFSWGPVGSPSQIEPIQILGGPLAVPIFSSLETLERFRREFPDLKVREGRIVKIEDTRMFFEDVPHHIAIALDPRKTPEGKMRYFDVSAMREPGQA